MVEKKLEKSNFSKILKYFSKPPTTKKIDLMLYYNYALSKYPHIFRCELLPLHDFSKIGEIYMS